VMALAVSIVYYADGQKLTFALSYFAV